MRVVMEMKVVIIALMTFCQFYGDHLSTTTMIMIKQPWINMTIWLQSMTLIINSWWRIAGAFYLVFIDFSQLALGFDIRHFLCTANVILKASFPVEISSARKFWSRISQRKKRFQEENWGISDLHSLEPDISFHEEILWNSLVLLNTQSQN